MTTPGEGGENDDAKPSTTARASRGVGNPAALLRTLRATYGRNLLVFIFSVAFGLKGALMQLVSTAALPYSQKYLKFTAEEMQRYGIVAMFPWTVKPLMGMISDLFPIGGYHKRYYIAVSSALGCAALVYLAVVEFTPGMGAWYVLGLVAINFQVATADLLTEGKYTERMREHPTKSSDMVSYVWMCITCGSVFATACSFFSIKYEAYRSLMWIAVPLSGQAVYTSLAGWLPEEKVVPRDERAENEAESGSRKVYGKELWNENWRVFVMSIFMASMCLLLGVVQFLQPENKYVDLAITFGITLVLSVSIYVALPRSIANVTFFLFLTSVLSVSFGSAMSYWFTVDEKCNPGGPHFDYLFFSVYTSIIARICTAIGVYLFQVFFSNANVRSDVLGVGDFELHGEHRRLLHRQALEPSRRIIGQGVLLDRRHRVGTDGWDDGIHAEHGFDVEDVSREYGGDDVCHLGELQQSRLLALERARRLRHGRGGD